MSAATLSPVVGHVTREGALRRISEGLHAVAEGFAELALCEPELPPVPRFAAPKGEESWVAWDVLAKEVGLSLSTLDRMTRGKACRRRARGRVVIERRGFTALLKRG